MQNVNGDDVEIAVIRKNSSEQLRITAGTYKGHRTVRIWVWYLGQDGEYHPGKNGVAFGASRLDDVMAALGRVRKAGVVPFPARVET